MSMSPLGNNTLASFKVDLARQLNDKMYRMWSETDLEGYIQRAVTAIYGEMIDVNPDLATKTHDFSYTANAESITITPSSGTVRRVKFIEDRTDYQPGPMWEPAQDREDLHSYNMIAADASRVYDAPRYMVDFEESGTGATLAMNVIVRAAPPPGTTRSLRLHYQSGGPTLSSSTFKTGLLPEAEEYAMWLAAIMAKFQEDEPPANWQAELNRAQVRFTRAIKLKAKRGPKRILYKDDG